MKILVTGGTGFMGTALVTRLADDGHQVTRLGSRAADLTRPDALDRFNGERFDQIYHLAAWTQAGDFCLRHPGEQWIFNQQINTTVLAWWSRCQPQAKLVAIGTSCAYDPNLPLVEENFLAGLPIDSLFTYGMTKRMLYVGLRSLAQQYGLKYLFLVPSTLYGPGYHTDGRQLHFIFDLLRKIVRGQMLGEPVVLWGDGYQSRELVLADDFVQAAVELAACTDNEVVNIGAGQEFAIRHFARLICDKVGYDFEQIQFDTSRYVGARSKCLDIARLTSLLPRFRQTPLEIGLRNTVAWFRSERAAWLTPAERDAALQVAG
ncbi:MAG: NAD-dependent epimerase/dehydratase family protein [Pirellulales bacterium]